MKANRKVDVILELELELGRANYFPIVADVGFDLVMFHLPIDVYLII
jgi:hypothetical protein